MEELEEKTKGELYRYFESLYDPAAHSSKKAPRKLQLSEIIVVPKLFQPRRVDSELVEDERHIEALIKTIEKGHELDPILVMPIKGNHVCIDGHHRIKAYQRAKITMIPAEIFTGEFREGWAQCIEGNIKDKLPMSTKDKMEATWSMYILTGFTWEEIKLKTKAGHGSLGRMADVKKRLIAKGLDPSSLTWEQARSGDKEGEPLTDDQMEAIKKEWAGRLAKTFGTKISDSPDIFAGALKFYSEQAANRVYDSLKYWYGDREAEENYDDGEIEF